VKIAILGCGVVGASIAYELSRIPEFDITVFDRDTPASGSTGAALGVLMGAISQKKLKSRAWKLREASLQRYKTLIPELEAQIDRSIPRNDNGILKLCAPDENIAKWETLIAQRRDQGFPLERLSPNEVRTRYPLVSTDEIVAAVYSPLDRQIQPIPLTEALVEAARQNGVQFEFNTLITDAEIEDLETRVCRSLIYKENRSISIDWVVVAAGLGSTPFTEVLREPVVIQPVLGQALEFSIDLPASMPTVTGNDVHLVPHNGRGWVGATVEFPDDRGKINAASHLLEILKQQAISFCPTLAKAPILRQWQGLRPRPVNRSAPIIEMLPGYANVVLASGHYRNGVLLAPATADAVRSIVNRY